MPVTIHQLRSVCAALLAAGLVGGMTGCATTPPEMKVPSRAERGAIPYQVGDRVYYPITDSNGFSEEGVASWYGPGFHGKLTSNGEVYDMHATTAAHKTLPFNTRVRVVNLDNQRETEVRINDRGPFAGNRIIDLSYQAAKELGMIKSGIAPVRLVVTQRPGSGGALEAGASYTVQLGVFQDRKNAERIISRLENSRMVPYEAKDAGFYRVLWGSSEDYATANALKERARRLGYDGAFIVIDPAARKRPKQPAASNF
ncbi:MAG: septal ring lytic transglycosylase RlpA family protein [Nitrospinaceae bacterium]|nr:MAG: septal ring lytic transglycosylase RlpA family protein [Nitrospinaceae bacterium]